MSEPVELGVTTTPSSAGVHTSYGDLLKQAELQQRIMQSSQRLAALQQKMNMPPPFSTTTSSWLHMTPPDLLQSMMSTSRPEEEEATMLEQLLKLYTMSITTKVTSPLPHFVGPPGSGKSSVLKQLADMLGVKLHTINVSRISPLELEGVQMPDKENLKLNLLHATFWTQLREGDILLLDEFLRGFPEVYNGLLDILTAREVAGFKLPNVFIVGASNSTVAYDSALEDRLLHITVPDPRKSSKVSKEIAQRLVDELGLMPSMVTDVCMQELLTKEIFPMYELLDSFVGKGRKSAGYGNAGSLEGHSLRHLVGQVKLRHVTIPALKELLMNNNQAAMAAKKAQYVVLYQGKNVPAGYEKTARVLVGNPKLTDLQQQNLLLNLQLIEMEKALATSSDNEKEQDDDLFD